jgi:hypothetical protein
MTVQPSEGSGGVPEQVISYSDAPHMERQVSVPPETAPSAPFTVAPFETWQI